MTHFLPSAALSLFMRRQSQLHYRDYFSLVGVSPPRRPTPKSTDLSRQVTGTRRQGLGVLLSLPSTTVNWGRRSPGPPASWIFHDLWWFFFLVARRSPSPPHDSPTVGVGPGTRFRSSCSPHLSPRKLSSRRERLGTKLRPSAPLLVFRVTDTGVRTVEGPLQS